MAGDQPPIPVQAATRPRELSRVRALEAESIHIFREVAAQFERPALLFSGGKDSAVLVRLARKAFQPAVIPLPLVHVDTGHNFPEVIEYRDRTAERGGLDLVVASVGEAIEAGRVRERPDGTRNPLQSLVLLDAIAERGFDALCGGGRRDEDRARAKERIFSLRNRLGQWDPHRQRPELWSLYNGLCSEGEHMRVFPLSNWTELDVWRYIHAERIAVPSIYFAHRRTVFRRDGLWLAPGEWGGPQPDEPCRELTVRYRTVGDMSCTGAIESTAITTAEVIEELAVSRVTERGATRADDRLTEAAMEDRKREGYF